MIACGAVADERAATNTGPTGTAPAVPVAAPTVTLTDTSFAACFCHHGQGQGLDGTSRYRVANPTSAAVTVRVKSITLVSVADGSKTTPTDFYVTFRSSDIHVGGQEAVVAAGAELAGDLDFYLDSLALPPPGRYTASITFEVGGPPLSVETAPFDVAAPTREG